MMKGCRQSTLFFSVLEMFRISSMVARRASSPFPYALDVLFCSVVKESSSGWLDKPIIVFIGVLSSWLMLARNAASALTDSSAASLAWW
jgi:hypothetical protein